MDLHSNHPYWLMKNGIPKSYPSLDKDMDVDIAIIGAGISGALCAYYLNNSGHSIAVFDKRHVGMGSTAASTSFLQYEIDTPLVKLAERIGENAAVQCHKLCRKAIYDIKDICQKLHPKFDFHLRPSLQYASFKKDREQLHSEYEIRLKHGFDVEWLNATDVRDIFGFDAPGAILSKDAGEVDAYLLTHSLLGTIADNGHKVYNNTSIEEITYQQKNVKLLTNQGFTVRAKHVIMATGYESLKYIPHKIADVHSTYAMISEPVPETCLWYKNSLVWETANPYMYFRVAGGNRILIGGKDDMFHNPATRDTRIKRKTDMLLHSFAKKLPDMPVKPDFSWAGAFVVTKNGLPYIGSIPERPHSYFALGYGGNGITFSVLAAEIIRDKITGKKNENAHLFAFDR